jgi:hypothetical protein
LGSPPWLGNAIPGSRVKLASPELKTNLGGILSHGFVRRIDLRSFSLGDVVYLKSTINILQKHPASTGVDPAVDQSRITV